MKAFVINLDRNTDRLAFVQEQFVRLGLDVERFPAVDGRVLTSEALRRVHSRVRSFIALKRMMSATQVAASLSHGGVYQAIVDRGLPSALVLEDDVVLGPGFLDALARVERFLDPTRPQILLFSGYGVAGADLAAPEIRPIARSWCADAYVITRPAAERIRRANFPVLTLADSFRRYCCKHGVELYRVLPATVRQADERFATENQVMPRPPWCVRLPLYALDWALWKLTGR